MELVSDGVSWETKDPCLETPYGFGCPCKTNSDCDSGYCVEAGVGAVCTTECFEDCPEGWDCRGISGFGVDLIFLCLPATAEVCEPCENDGECENGICDLTDDGGFCLPYCPEEGNCPEATECALDHPHGDGTVDVCMPVSGSCACNESNSGEIRPCNFSNEHGTCEGFETCVPGEGWVDCNAAVPGPEICDGKDNNCDGTTDEGFLVDGVYGLDEHCGNCNQDCDQLIANGSGVCDVESYEVPKCVVDQCDPGFYQAGAFQCLPPVSGSSCQVCVNDDDCLGGLCMEVDGKKRCLEFCGGEGECPVETACQTVEEGLELCVPLTGSCECNSASEGTKKSCFTTNEIGTCEGTQTCDAEAGWSDCNAPEAVPESCDGKDNDCNGLVDDGLGNLGECTIENEFGTCPGVSVCGGVLGIVCQGTAPSAEICDGKDNNCDGAADETFKDAQGNYAQMNHCGECNYSCAGLFPNAVAQCAVGEEGPYCNIAECAAGYFLVNEFQCAPEEAGLCEPCVENADCPGDAGVCATFSDGDFCTKPCQEAAECGVGYNCILIEGVKLCKPTTGACECSAENEGMSKGCHTTWPPDPPEDQKFITCYGQQLCTEHGWDDCVLPGEVCDGVDNDCNGVVDDTFTVDGKYVQDEHCGKCGNDCTKLTPPGAAATCNTALAQPKCELACLEGYADKDNNLANGCECQFTGGADYPDGEDQNCDGIDGELDKAIFVAKWGNDANTGMLNAPLATIAAGLAKAKADGKRDVYVAEGVYSGSVLMEAGIQLYGGFSSDFKKWDPGNHATEVKGGEPTPELPGAMVAIDITGETPTVVAGFVLRGKDAATPGASSYALYVRDCDGSLRISDNLVLAGHGSPGIPGAAGKAGATGGDGKPGVGPTDLLDKSCNPELQTAGGAGGISSCGDTDASGGVGGDGLCPIFEEAPSEGEMGSPGLGATGGAGGQAGWDSKAHHASCKMCILPNTDGPLEGTNGAPGGPGAPGMAGMGCVAAMGDFEDGLWLGLSGGEGASGSAGSGGGGGGAGGGVDSDKAKCNDFTGGTGGGGGGGGCGGGGGLGGSAGGASFGIFLYFTEAAETVPEIVGNVIEGGSGGSGGPGGNGGAGGLGGSGAVGGPAGGSTVWCVFGGGDGGAGGAGGAGGGGGGGCGGPSYCVFVAGEKPAGISGYKNPNNSCVPGIGGAGGGGGLSPAAPGQPGMPGTSAEANF